MSAETGLFILAVIVAAALLFCMVFFIIMFSDLECDYINPIELCNKLNHFVIPEYSLHAVLTALFLLNMQLFPFIVNAPLVAWHAQKYTNRQHIYDATEIFKQLGRHKRDAFIKLGFYLVCFFYYLYRMILALVSKTNANEPIPNI
eukprot:Nk52_evm27s164 gene=Nk52_evmTU27s164